MLFLSFISQRKGLFGGSLWWRMLLRAIPTVMNFCTWSKWFIEPKVKIKNFLFFKNKKSLLRGDLTFILNAQLNVFASVGSHKESLY